MASTAAERSRASPRAQAERGQRGPAAAHTHHDASHPTSSPEATVAPWRPPPARGTASRRPSPRAHGPRPAADRVDGPAPPRRRHQALRRGPGRGPPRPRRAPTASSSSSSAPPAAARRRRCGWWPASRSWTRGPSPSADQTVNDVEPRHRDVAMVFQTYALYPHLTVARNIEFPLRQRGIEREERLRRVARGGGHARPRPLPRRASPGSSRAASASGWPWPGPSSASRPPS